MDVNDLLEMLAEELSTVQLQVLDRRLTGWLLVRTLADAVCGECLRIVGAWRQGHALDEVAAVMLWDALEPVEQFGAALTAMSMTPPRSLGLMEG